MPRSFSRKPAGTLIPELAKRWNLGADVVISASPDKNCSFDCVGSLTQALAERSFL